MNQVLTAGINAVLESHVQTQKSVSTASDNVKYLPLKPAGYPISTDDLDFGDGSPDTKQINNASLFAQLVNQIPNPGQESWSSSGDLVWDIWRYLLESIQLPSGASTSIISDMEASFKIDQRTDMMGNIYYRTGYTPTTFWSTEVNGTWNSLEYPADTSSLTTETAPSAVQLDAGTQNIQIDPTGMLVKMDTILVTLLRNWWSTWLFDSNKWRIDPNSIVPPLSDGKSPPSGSMTMYANSFMLARSVDIKLDMNLPTNIALANQLEKIESLALGPLALKGNLHSAEATAPQLSATVTQDGLASTGMQILGFNCNVLPKTPDPDPSLDW